MGLDWPTNNKGNSVFLSILQLLPTIYKRFQHNIKTIIRTNKKGAHRQVGRARQGTTSIQQTKDKTHNSTSTGLLEPDRTNQDGNSRFKIHLLRDTITAVLGQKIETSGISSQNNVGCGVQLWYTGQRTSDYSSGIPRMETLYKWKPEACASPHRLQRLSNLHDNEGSKRRTSSMDSRTKSIKLQKQMSARNRRGRPDSLRRPAGDLSTAGDKRLTRHVGILLTRKRYWDIPDTENIKLDMFGATEFYDEDEGKIPELSQRDDEIQAIKWSLDKGAKEMKGIVLRLCHCKSNLL